MATKLYDDKGCLTATGEDLCDCKRVKCPGCFFPCKKCRSPKCGPVCRVNRNFVYKFLTCDTSGGAPVDIDENPLPSTSKPSKSAPPSKQTTNTPQQQQESTSDGKARQGFSSVFNTRPPHTRRKKMRGKCETRIQK